MVKLNEIYKCKDCGHLIEVVNITEQENMSCCKGEMQLLEAQREDKGYEKHVPVIEKTNSGIKVKVGSVEHPMVESHYIQFIELIVDDKVFRKQLKPGQKPEAEFIVSGKNIIAREYCNLHGLWKKE
jgi:superoxide reductase